MLPTPWLATLLILHRQYWQPVMASHPHPPCESGTQSRGYRNLHSAIHRILAVRQTTDESVDAPDHLWETASQGLFHTALEIQVFRFTARGALADWRWVQLLSMVRRVTDLPLVVWDLSQKNGVEALTADNSPFRSAIPRDNPLGRGYIVLAEELEANWTRLLSAPVWFTRGSYLVLLDAGSGRCHGDPAVDLSKALWQRHRVGTVAVSLARCPWRLHLYAPYEVPGRMLFTGSNVSEVKAVVKRRYHNFYGRPWRIAVYPNAPTLLLRKRQQMTSTPGQPGKWYDGVDGWFMEAAAKYFNFDPVVKYPSDNETHGYAMDGKGTGTLGLVMTMEALISFNSRFLKSYNTDSIEFSYPYTFDELCVMVPRARRIPNYVTLFRCFQPNVWSVLLCLYVVVVGVVRWGDGVHGVHSSGTTAAFATCVLLTFGSTVSPYSRARELSAVLVFTLGLLFNVVFMGAFQGLLFKSLTSRQYYPEIDSLDALANSNLQIITKSFNLKDTFSFDDQIMRRIASNFRVVSRDSLQELQEAPSFLVRRNTAYMRPENRRQHLVDECPRKYLLGYIAHRDFPFLRELDSLLFRCAAAGLIHIWLRWSYTSKPEPRAPTDNVLTMAEVQAAFFVLFLGFLAGGVTLIWERIRYRQCGAPNYLKAPSFRTSYSDKNAKFPRNQPSAIGKIDGYF